MHQVFLLLQKISTIVGGEDNRNSHDDPSEFYGLSRSYTVLRIRYNIRHFTWHLWKITIKIGLNVYYCNI